MSEAIASWRRSGLAWWWLGTLMLLVDQATKQLLQAKLALHESIYLLPVLEIVHARNPGVAFSMFDRAAWSRQLFTALAVLVGGAILVALRRISASQRLQCSGLVLIASGALGNAIDRARLGYVVDFVGVHWNDAWFPAFNVADSCISVGAALILLDALMQWRRERRVVQ